MKTRGEVSRRKAPASAVKLARASNRGLAARGGRVILSRARYQRMVDELEELRDVALAARLDAERDKAQYLPVELVERLLAGEHPVRIWRERRVLTMSGLAHKAGVPQGYLSEIENSKKPGSVAALKALAAALDVTIGDLVR